jgi:hypothetical protein
MDDDRINEVKKELDEIIEDLNLRYEILYEKIDTYRKELEYYDKQFGEYEEYLRKKIN